MLCDVMRDIDAVVVRRLHGYARRNHISRVVVIAAARWVVWLEVLLVAVLLVRSLGPAGVVGLVVPFGVWPISFTLKRTIRARRPYQVLPDVRQLFHVPPYAFPSGHGVVMCSLTVFVWGMWGPLLGGIYALASLLSAAARVAAGVHWPRDMLGAAVLVGVYYSVLLVFLEK